ncbi:MAG: hypothetical protein ACRCX2_13335 [Paraclostridium sp.]
MSRTPYLDLNIPDKSSKGFVVTDVFEPNFTKLDQEAEMVNLRKMSTEDNIEELKKATRYKAGDVVEVLGYYSAGDGAGHTRQKKAVGYNGADAVIGVDGSIWGIVHNGEVNVSWFGAKGDGVTDDAPVFRKVVSYCKGDFTIKLPKGKFLMNSGDPRGLLSNGVFEKPNEYWGILELHDNMKVEGTGEDSCIIYNEDRLGRNISTNRYDFGTLFTNFWISQETMSQPKSINGDLSFKNFKVKWSGKGVDCDGIEGQFIYVHDTNRTPGRYGNFNFENIKFENFGGSQVISIVGATNVFTRNIVGYKYAMNTNPSLTDFSFFYIAAENWVCSDGFFDNENSFTGNIFESHSKNTWINDNVVKSCNGVTNVVSNGNTPSYFYYNNNDFNCVHYLMYWFIEDNEVIGKIQSKNNRITLYEVNDSEVSRYALNQTNNFIGDINVLYIDGDEVNFVLRETFSDSRRQSSIDVYKHFKNVEIKNSSFYNYRKHLLWLDGSVKINTFDFINNNVGGHDDRNFSDIYLGVSGGFNNFYRVNKNTFTKEVKNSNSPTIEIGLFGNDENNTSVFEVTKNNFSKTSYSLVKITSNGNYQDNIKLEIETELNSLTPYAYSLQELGNSNARKAILQNSYIKTWNDTGEFVVYNTKKLSNPNFTGVVNSTYLTNSEAYLPVASVLTLQNEFRPEYLVRGSDQVWRKFGLVLFGDLTQLDTPYHASNMQKLGILDSYYNYLTELHEYEKQQNAKYDTGVMNLNVIQPPVIPVEVGEYAKEYNLT